MRNNGELWALIKVLDKLCSLQPKKSFSHHKMTMVYTWGNHHKGKLMELPLQDMKRLILLSTSKNTWRQKWVLINNVQISKFGTDNWPTLTSSRKMPTRIIHQALTTSRNHWGLSERPLHMFQVRHHLVCSQLPRYLWMLSRWLKLSILFQMTNTFYICCNHASHHKLVRHLKEGCLRSDLKFKMECIWTIIKLDKVS